MADILRVVTLRETALLSMLMIGGLLTAMVEARAASQHFALKDLTWMTGDWQGEEGGTWIQEVWSPPRAGTMIGMFRMVSDGQPVFYEFMSVEMGSTGPILRIKHFNPGLQGWEDKDESVAFALKQTSANKAVFETEIDGQIEYLTYDREGDSLTVTLDKPAKSSRSVFRFQRAKP